MAAGGGEGRRPPALGASPHAQHDGYWTPRHSPSPGFTQAAAPLLERYGTGAFATVAAETASSVKEIAELLRGKLRDPATSPDDAAEALELLQMLRMPQDELQREWLAERRRALQEAMASAEASWARRAGSADAAPPDVREFVAAADREFLMELCKTAQQYNDLFPESRRALVELARSSLAEYLGLLRRVLSPSDGPLPAAKSLMAALAQLAADLAQVARLLPEARLDDRAAEMVEKSVRGHVMALFQRHEESVAAALAAALAALPPQRGPGEAPDYGPLLSVQATLCADTLEGMLRLLREVAALQDERPVLLSSWRDVFADLVQAQAQSWFTGLTATIIAAAGLPPMPEAARMATKLAAAAPPPPPADPQPAPAVFLLALLRVLSFLEDRAVEAVQEKLAPFAAASGEEPTFDAGAVLKLLRTAQSRLLVGYVQQQGRKLSKLVRTSMAAPDWLNLKEPRDVRPVCDFLLAELKVVNSEVAQLMTGPGDAAQAHAGGARGGAGAVRASLPAGGAGGKEGSKAIARNVAKLFQEKLKIFDEVEQTRDAVLLGALKVALKSWVECVRLVTLGRAGFQQLQLDVHYMRPALRAYAAASADVVDTLLDEVATAAAERSIEPTPLEAGTLDYILASRRGAAAGTK